MKGKPTASYKLIADAGGTRFQFFCDLSGAHACTSEPIRADTPEEAAFPESGTEAPEE